jgi:DNA-binding CsgD family transcriptional regulator
MELASGVQETLHGRSGDLAAVPASGTLVFCGEPGIGKSALLRRVQAVARGTVLSAPGNLDETDLPYAGLQRVLAAVAQQPCVLRDALDGRTPTAGRLALGLATLTVLRRVAPVLVLLDDADLLDSASWDVLTVAARRIAGEPITVLATMSDASLAVGLPVRRLAGLDADAAHDLLPDLPGDVAAALIELAGGNPAALIDLAAALTPGQRRGTEPPPVTLPAGSPLARAYRAALAALPAESRWLLLLAAAGEDLDPADLVAAAVAAGTDPAALEPAESAGLIEVGGGAVTFRSPALRAAAYYGAPIGRRRSAHATLAATLTARGGRLRGMLHRAAAASGPDERLAADLIAAAADGPHLAASAAHEHAAALTGDAIALVTAARHAWQGGQPHRAARLLRRLPPAPAGTLTQARAAHLAAEMAAGDQALLGAAEQLIPYDVPAAIEALLTAGEARYVAGDHLGCQRIVGRALELRRDDAPVGVELAFNYFAGLTAMLAGSHAVAFTELHQVIHLAERSVLVEPAAVVRAARAALLVGDGPAARRLALHAASLARSRGEVAQVPRALEAAAFADLSAGRHEDAAASAGEGAMLARATGQAGLAESHLGILAVLAALTGDRETAMLRVRAADAQDTAEGPSQSRALCAWALALLDLIEGRPLASAERLQTLVATRAGRGNVVLQVAVTPHLVEAASRCTEPICVEDAARAFDQWAGATGLPTWLALRERCRALRAADPRSEDRHFGEALRQHSAGDSDFARAHTELLYGRSLRRRRRPAAAREHLRRSVETFRLLDLAVWAGQADVELRAAGEHVATAVPPAALTAQQQRIARLVADGATNREVAQQLFLSPRTIDHHLRNIFVRLGVRSRTELARRVATGP